MYKKVIVLALACITAVMLAACGGNAASSSASPSAASSGGASASAASSSTAVDFEKGTVSGDAYTNGYFGIKFTLPDDWAFATEGEVAELNGKAASSINDTQVVEMLENGQAFIDMFARKSDKLANVNLSYEKIDSSSASVSPKDVLKNASAAAKKELESQGFSDVKMEESTVQFCGDSVPCVNFTYEIQGTPVYQCMTAMVQGDYIMTVAASTAKTDTCADVLGRFETV